MMGAIRLTCGQYPEKLILRRGGGPVRYNGLPARAAAGRWHGSSGTERVLMNKLLLVFIGGGIGTAVRYGTTLMAGKLFGTGFPWGTLMVNLGGCFLIGIFLALAEKTTLVQPATRLFLVTGFLGGLTTFSSYAMESVVAFRSSASLALANIAVNNLAGLALVFFGLKLTEQIL